MHVQRGHVHNTYQSIVFEAFQKFIYKLLLLNELGSTHTILSIHIEVKGNLKKDMKP